MTGKKTVQEDTAELFDARVEDYDSFAHAAIIDYDDIINSIKDIARLYLKKSSKPKVLDLGTGTGNSSLAILEVFPHARLTGLDVSQKMVERIRERMKRFDYRAICGDVLGIKFKGEFDLAISSIVYHHLDDRSKARGYKKVFNALKKGGLFILADIMVAGEKKLNEMLTDKWSGFIEYKRGAEYRDGIFALDGHHHQYAALNDNLKYLKAAGFRTEVYLRKLNSAVICAFK